MTGAGPSPHLLLREVSREMVRVYKEQLGRGPTRTRTDWAGHDVLVVTLEQTLTIAERRLCALGLHEQLREVRALLQRDRDDFCAPVERITGRKVRALVSGMDAHTDVCTEIFALHPAGYDGPSRYERCG